LAAAAGDVIVSFSTRFLGRNGYLSVNLIDGPETIEQSKIQALAILTAVHFAPGFRYEDQRCWNRPSGAGPRMSLSCTCR
jgi:uncharacterized membrane-anchored protein